MNALVARLFVQFDDDDYYGKDYLATMVKCFESPIDFAKLSGWYVYSERYQELGYWDVAQMCGLHLCWSKAPMSSVVFGDAYMESNGPRALIGFGFSYAYRRNIWEKVKFPDKNLGEDSDFISSVLAEGGRLYQFADTAGICVHILHKSNTSKCYPQYRLPPFMVERIVPAWAAEMLCD
jgi:cellulose synthase/poly-beta-1,6-N-acetylglucosamine synthase-like glycosyltransferase